MKNRAVVMVAIAVVLAALMGLSPASGGATKKSPFKPGLYVGKTSQGEPVKLRLTVGGAACEGSPCLFAPSDPDQIYIGETCDNPEASTNEYLALFYEKLPRSGVLHIHQVGFSTTTATLKVGHDGSLTGKARSTSTLEGGIKCDSGNVTFKAKIGGSTK